MERNKGEGKKMSLLKKLIAGSALILTAGCDLGTIGSHINVNGAKAKLTHGFYFTLPRNSYLRLTVEENNCQYDIKTLHIRNKDNMLLSAKVDCTQNQDGKMPQMRSPQEVFDQYYNLIAGELQR